MNCDINDSSFVIVYIWSHIFPEHLLSHTRNQREFSDSKMTGSQFKPSLFFESKGFLLVHLPEKGIHFHINTSKSLQQAPWWDVRGFEDLFFYVLLSALEVNLLGWQTWSRWNVFWTSRELESVFNNNNAFYLKRLSKLSRTLCKQGKNVALCKGIRKVFRSQDVVYSHVSSQEHTKLNTWGLNMTTL